ncbi:LysR family transcriptional regulator [Burkholderia sp. Bp9143]|uniref:LysR family transcriptional regulator n=1 Tax=Burkholderia sp. Bp9143 TaxID=2184574 RepID=UPI000F5A75D5|nr:LysR family transcriptional regulator [Burkholderia sp. Bp9143]RQR22985.1 LysR family transcriptional regulator [Burkholderia sp. Bp9143]
MEREAFKLFIEVAEVGSISRVAALRQTVQSNISRQIAEFERECGGRLFERTGRGVKLTGFGERIIPRIRAWIADTDQLFNEIRTSSGTPFGEVRIGILPSTAHPLMTTLCERINAAYPDIRLNVRESQLGEVETWLDSGRVDLAILFHAERSMTTERLATLATIETYLVGAPDSPLLQRETVEFRHLEGVPLILPGRPNRLRNIMDDEARRAGIELRTVLEADSLAVQREVAASGRGYAVLGPWAIAPDVRAGRLRAARIIKPHITRFVTLASSSQGAMTPAIRIVIATLKEIASEFSESGVYDGLSSQRVERDQRTAPSQTASPRQTAADRPALKSRKK